MGRDRVDVALRATDRLRRAIDRRAFAQVRIKDAKDEQKFLYDCVFGGELHDLATSAVLRGTQCAIICYGQTGSGKTHTMEGLTPLCFETVAAACEG